MTNRLITVWLVFAVLGLIAVATATGQGLSDRIERRSVETIRAVAADWIDGFSPTIEPNRPLDTVPGLRSVLAPLSDTRLGIVGASLILPSGHEIAVQGSVPDLTGKALDALFGADTEPSFVRRHALPLQMEAGPDRILGVPLQDWTGLARGALLIVYRIRPVAPWGGTLMAWPLPEGLLLTGSACGLVGWLGWRRRLPPDTGPIRLRLAAALGLVLLLASIAGAVRTVATDMLTATRALDELGERLKTPPAWWNDRMQRLVERPLEARLVRLARAVPELEALSIERVSGSQPTHHAGFTGDRTFELPPGEPHRLVARLDQAAFRSQAMWLLVKAATIALFLSLSAHETMVAGASGPRPGRGPRARAPAATPPIFLIACASSVVWPALIGLAEGPGTARPDPALPILCVATEAIAAALGAWIAVPLAERYGWRSVALPGAIAGLIGSVALCCPLTSGPAALVVWATIGLGAGLALPAGGRTADAASGWRFGLPGPLAGLAGQIAGLALGAAALIVLGSVAAKLVAVMAWVVAGIDTGRRRNDSQAGLRRLIERAAATEPARAAVAGLSDAPGRTAALLASAMLLALAQVLLSQGLPKLDPASRARPGASMRLTVMPDHTQPARGSGAS